MEKLSVVDCGHGHDECDVAEGLIMPMKLVTVMFVGLMAGTTTAQPMNENSIPREIGNRANGFDYQPRPNIVLPREASAGILPSKAQQDATDREVVDLDKSLLRSEGLSTKNAPYISVRK